MVKLFLTAFADSGDLTPVPVAPQSNGSVSYTQGFGPNYELTIGVDPNALAIPRSQTNQLYNDITGALQQYQTVGTFPFITSAQNGGVPYSYTLGARVQYDDGSGLKNYESLIASNTTTPSVSSTTWRVTSASNVVTPGNIQTSSFIFGTNTGTANDIVVSPTPTYATFTAGTVVKVLLSAANSGPVTLKIGSASPVNVQTATSTGLSDLVGDELNAGIFEFIYTGSVFQVVNPIASSVPPVPIGTILDFGGTTTPPGFLLCDGAAVSRTTYADLFDVIDILWGAGDGSTTFNVPDFNRKTTIGSGGTGTAIIGNSVGNTGGEEKHTMTLAEIAPHTHTVSASPTTGTLVAVLQEISSNTPVNFSTNSTGSATPFNVIQPSAVVNKIIRYTK